MSEKVESSSFYEYFFGPTKQEEPEIEVTEEPGWFFWPVGDSTPSEEDVNTQLYSEDAWGKTSDQFSEDIEKMYKMEAENAIHQVHLNLCLTPLFATILFVSVVFVLKIASR